MMKWHDSHSENPEKIGMPISKTMCAALFIALLGTLAPTAAAYAQSAPKSDTLSVDGLVNNFDTVVFGQAGTQAANAFIVKWPQDTVTLALEEPHARIDPAMSKKFLGMVKNHVAMLSKLTGKKFRGVHDAATADIRIFFVRQADMGKIYGPNIDPKAVEAGAKAGGCYSIRWRKTASELFKVITVVNVERDPALTDSCLLRELTQSMGLPHNSDAMRPSIFSKGDHLETLSLPDQILIRTLYDPRMKAGMKREEALKTARTIISEMGKPAK